MKKTAALIGAVVLLAACHRNPGQIRAPGIVDGEVVSLRALAAGTVTRLAVEQGQTVTPGTLIAELDRAKITNSLQGLDLSERELANSEERTRKKLTLVQNNLAYWRKQAERFERLSREQAIPGEQLEKARLQEQEAATALYDLEKALAALGIQKEKLANQRLSLQLLEKDLVFVAPVAGSVLETFVSAGETILPGAAVCDILDQSSLYIEVFIEERELAKLKLNSRAGIEVDGFPGREFSGLIIQFGRKAEFSPKYIVSEKERQALLYMVKIRIDRDQEAFKIGMPVTVVFTP